VGVASPAYLQLGSQSPLAAAIQTVTSAQTITSLVAAALAAVPAGDPIFMKYGGITGDVTAKGYAGDILLNAFQWGLISTGREASAPSVSEITVSKRLDSASVSLMGEALGGTPSDVEIDFVSGKLQTYLKLDLSNVLISGYSMSSGGDRPTESLSLNFTKISFTEVGIKGDTQSFEYDLAQNNATEVPAVPAVQSPPSALARSSIFMKYDSIAGDVTAKGYAGDSQLSSLQWGVSRDIGSPAGGADREASAPSVSEVVITKNLDSASAPLFQEALGGTPSDVELDFANGKSQTYLKLDLSNVLISGYSMSSGGDRPTESLSLNFTKISFNMVDIKGTAQSFDYDLAQNNATEVPAVQSPAAASAKSSIFMKYGSIAGDVTAKGYVGDTQLTSLQWGVSRDIGSLAGAAGREASAPSVSEVTITKNLDSASAPLFQEALGGTPSDVEIDFASGKLQTYLKLDLSNVLISGYSMSSGGDRPTESLSLNFTKISFNMVDIKGTAQSFDYDLAQSNATEVPAVPAVQSPPAASAKSSIFMKYDSIAGDVTAKGYVGDTQLTSVQWGVGRGIGSPASGADREASAPSVSEVTITKNLDSASASLFREALGGTPSDVEIDFASGKLQTYLKMDLSNVLISGYSMSSGGDRPTESLSLNFTKISFNVVGIKGATQSFDYDLAQNNATEVPAVPAVQSPPAASARSSIFMKYGSIAGDVTAKGYVGDTQLTSLQWGVGRGIGSPAGGADREASAPSVSEVVVTKNLDSASAPLLGEALGGTPSDVELDFASGKLQTYLKLDLSNVLISGYSMSSGGDRPTESLSLNFTKISFNMVDIKGTAQSFDYDLAQNNATEVPAVQSPAAASARSSIFMKYGSIVGDVTAKGYVGDSQLSSLQWGVSRGIGSPAGGADREASAPSVSEVIITKNLDSASASLFQEALGGTPSDVEIDFASGKLQTYLKLDLSNVLISGYSLSSGGDRPTESLSLNFTKISFNVVGTKGNTQTVTYDLATGVLV